MPGHTNLKWQYQSEGTFDVYLQAKNQLHPSRFSWDIAKICKLVALGTLGMSCYTHPKGYYQFGVYLQAKNQLHLPSFFWDIAKICKLLILGTLGMHGYKHPK